MKKKILNIVRTFFAGAALVSAISCSDVNTCVENQSDSPVLKVQVNENSRTILPDFNDFAGFSFRLFYGSEELADSSSVEDLTSKYISLPLDKFTVGNNYTFTLTASKGALELEANSTLTIANGVNTLPMQLFLTSSGIRTGTGKLAYTFDFSSASNASDVVSANVQIYDFNETESGPVLDEWFTNGEQAETALPESCKLEINKDSFPVGNYYVIVKLYAEDNALLTRWDEDLIVAQGLTSKGDSKLTMLNKAFTVTFDFNYQGSTPFTVTCSRFTAFEDVAPSSSKTVREGYVFTGWYWDKAGTSRFDPNKDRLDGSALYAKWESVINTDGSYNITADTVETVFAKIVEDNPSQPVTLKVLGDASSNSLSKIADEVKNHADIKVKLNFKDSTNFIYLYTEFSYCSNLVEITLPKTLTEINYSPFTECSSLEKIYIASGNTRFEVKDYAAVYDKERNALVAYAPANNATSLTIPKEITWFTSGVLYELKNITSFYVETGNTKFTAENGVLYSADGRTLIAYPAGNTNSSFTVPLKVGTIKPFAFYKCANLTEITFEDTNPELRYSNYDRLIFNDKKSELLVNFEEGNTLYWLITYNYNYYYYNTSMACVSVDAETVRAYDTLNYYIQSGNFTITDFDSIYKTRCYKLATTEGKKYKLFWTSDGNGYSDVPENMDYCVIGIYSSNGEQLLYAYGSIIQEFTAGAGDTTYIVVNPYQEYYTCKCAFRIMNYDPDVTISDTIKATVDVKQDDIGVDIYDCTDPTQYSPPFYQFLVTTGSYDSYKWYVDGLLDTDWTGYEYHFYLSYYAPDIAHTITLEATKGNEYYSYSAQIKVQGKEETNEKE